MSRIKQDELAGYRYLNNKELTLIPVDSPDHFTESTPTSDLIRQVLGAVAQYQKPELIAKLRGTRQRVKASVGRCEGRKPAPEAARALAKELQVPANNMVPRASSGCWLETDKFSNLVIPQRITPPHPHTDR
jgi:hypothetical protein